MLGNYKLVSDRVKLHTLGQCADSCLTETGNVNLRFLLGHLHTSSPSHFLLFSAHSLVLSVSIYFPSSSFPLLCRGMCISAVFDESVVNGALCLLCMPVFLCFMCLHVVYQNETDKNCQQEKQRQAQCTSTGKLPTQNLGGYSKLWTAAKWVITNQVYTPGSVNSL